MQISIPTVNWNLPVILIVIITLAIILFSMKPIMRYMIKRISNDITGKLLTDDYTQNLAELLPSLKRFSILNLLEMSLRAQTGKIFNRLWCFLIK
jgi:hypothetical protein